MNKNNKTTTKETYEIPHDEIAWEFSRSFTCKIKDRDILPIFKLIEKHNKIIKKDGWLLPGIPSEDYLLLFSFLFFGRKTTVTVLSKAIGRDNNNNNNNNNCILELQLCKERLMNATIKSNNEEQSKLDLLNATTA